MNTYLKYQPPSIQFLSFLMLAGGFFFADILIASYFFNDMYAVLLDKNAVIPSELSGQFKGAQIVTSSISFIIPAFLFGYFSSPKALPYLGVQKTIAPVLLISCVVLLFCIQPFIGWLGTLNEGINFVAIQKGFQHFFNWIESLTKIKVNIASWQKGLEEKEALYNRALKVFLSMNSVGDLLINLLVMALLPALGEELFFRGTLQKSLLRLSNKPWLAIVITSAVFGLLHGTFFKLLPIFTLGLLLGTVYHVTRNLWYTITIHFLNNAFAVLSVYYADRSDILKKLANDNISVPLYSALLSLVIGIGIIYFIKRKSDEVLPEIITNEDNDYIA